MPKVEKCSALKNTGIDNVWGIIEEHQKLLIDKGILPKKRQEQTRSWLKETLAYQLQENFYQNPAVKAKLPEIEKKVVNGQLSALAAANQLLRLLK